jgi:dienelactone hydrolase
MQQILIEAQTISGIPTMILLPQAAQACPLVFYVPGYGAPKESGLGLGYRLAQAGCCFVAFDPLLHGERFDPRLFDAANPERGGIYPPDVGLDIGATFYEVIGQCLDDVRMLLEHFASDPRLDTQRCAVTGPSMGGYASFLIFANLPQMLAAVPMIGIPTFTRRWMDLLDESAFSNPAWAEALARAAEGTQRHTAMIAAMDPADKLLEAAPRALLIMNCDFDSDQPKHYSIEFYRQLLPAYHGHLDKLRLAIYPAGHTVTPDMERDAVAWIVGHLLEGHSQL